MRKFFLMGLISVYAVSLAYSAKIDLTIEEANLSVQCINTSPVANVASAFEPLQLRDKMLGQAQTQIASDKDRKNIVFDLNDTELNLLLACIQKAPAANVSMAEQPIKLARKIINQVQSGQSIQAPEKPIKKEKKKSKKSSKKKKK